MSADHSPTPWVLKDHGAVFDAEGGYVCDFAIGTYVNKKANARLMVQAVNAHDELVAALGGLIDFIDEIGGDEADMPRYKAATAALTKATESK